MIRVSNLLPSVSQSISFGKGNTPSGKAAATIQNGGVPFFSSPHRVDGYVIKAYLTPTKTVKVTLETPARKKAMIYLIGRDIPAGANFPEYIMLKKGAGKPLRLASSQLTYDELMAFRKVAAMGTKYALDPRGVLPLVDESQRKA